MSIEKPVKEMAPAVEAFVERMGLMMESEGMSRIAGRLYGFLLIHDEAYSLDDLAERLQVSKASVSTNARFLEQIGIVERISSPGDRRDYYRMGSQAMVRSLRAAQRRWVTLQALFQEGAASLPSEMEVGRLRLAEVTRFHALMGEAVERLIADWEKKGEGG